MVAWRSVASKWCEDASFGELGHLVSQLERRLQQDPWDPELRATLGQGQDLVSALPSPARAHLGARLGQPLAWDPWSVTFEGRCLETGRPGLVRLRRHTAAPWGTRCFDLIRRALASLQPELRADADGMVLLSPEPSDQAALRLLLLGLASLQRWCAGGQVPTGPRWVTLGPQGARWICLDARRADPSSVQACLETLVEATRAAGRLPEGVQDLVAGWGHFPPSDLDSATEAVLRALRRDLVERWLDLRDRSVQAVVTARTRRLQHLMVRLGRALPAPPGRAVLGVDAAARPILVQADHQGTRLFPVGMPPEHLGRDALEIQPAVARRLLRARAAGPPSTRLQGEAGGDAAWLEWMGRWTSASLRLRLLLDLAEAG